MIFGPISVTQKSSFIATCTFVEQNHLSWVSDSCLTGKFNRFGAGVLNCYLDDISVSFNRVYKFFLRALRIPLFSYAVCIFFFLNYFEILSITRDSSLNSWQTYYIIQLDSSI